MKRPVSRQPPPLARPFVGVVQKKLWAQGSKSEHTATVLQPQMGSAFRLQMNGGNAFDYSAFQPYLGQTVTVHGHAHGQILLVTSIK